MLKRDRKQQQKRELDRQLRSICSKLDEGNVKVGIRMVAGDDKIAEFGKLKHPHREVYNVLDPTDIDWCSTSEFFDYKAAINFRNSSSASLNGISPKFECFYCQVEQ